MALSVRFDTTAVELCADGAGWDEISCLIAELSLALGIVIPAASEVCRADRPLDRARRARVSAGAAHLQANVARGLDFIAPVLPEVVTSATHDVNVILLPDSSFCYGPVEGIQLFGVSADASRFELLYFFSHVLFHELTALAYTPRCRRVSKQRVGFADELYWLMLLIRNEGLGNFPFIPLLETDLRGNLGARLQYFTYWDWLKSPVHQKACLHYLERYIAELRATQGQPDVPLISMLKRFRVPAVNILGVMMTEVIAKHHGPEKLRELLLLNAECFFEEYGRISERDESLLRIDWRAW